MLENALQVQDYDVLLKEVRKQLKQSNEDYLSAEKQCKYKDKEYALLIQSLLQLNRLGWRKLGLA